MGPRRSRLHRTKRLVWVLMWSLCPGGKLGKTRRCSGQTWVETELMKSISLISILLQVLPSPLSGADEKFLMLLRLRDQRRTERAGCSQNKPKQYKPTYPWKCSHLMFVTVSVLLLCLVSLLLCNLYLFLSHLFSVWVGNVCVFAFGKQLPVRILEPTSL